MRARANLIKVVVIHPSDDTHHFDVLIVISDGNNSQMIGCKHDNIRPRELFNGFLNCQWNECKKIDVWCALPGMPAFIWHCIRPQPLKGTFQAFFVLDKLIDNFRDSRQDRSWAGTHVHQSLSISSSDSKIVQTKRFLLYIWRMQNYRGSGSPLRLIQTLDSKGCEVLSFLFKDEASKSLDIR